MSDYITIPLSKYGKNRGKYEAIVSIEDAILAQDNWCVSVSKYTSYALRKNVKDMKPNLISLHREVMERKLGHDIPDGYEVDHIDGNGLNNTRDNLRLATKTQNGLNRGKNKNNKSGYKGVSWDKKRRKWVSQIWIEGKPKNLGLFVTKEQAKEAVMQAREEYHGDFANHGD